MGIDVQAAMAQKTELDRAADDITSMILQLEKTRGEFVTGWRSPEIYDMESAFDENIRRLERIRAELQETGQCILKNADDIQREEEERRAREEAERRAREEAERRAREEADRRAREQADRRAAEEAARDEAARAEAARQQAAAASAQSNNTGSSGSTSSSGGGIFSGITNFWKSLFR